jgi:hypothetical protein
LIVDDIDDALPDDIIAIVVLRLEVGAEPRDAQHQLARRERFIFDLPDREVWIASTRSSTAGVNDAQVHAAQRECDEPARAHYFSRAFVPVATIIAPSSV